MRIRRPPPEDDPRWAHVVAAARQHVPHHAALGERERGEFARLAATFAARTRWEAANRFSLTDEMIGTIAGHAALLTLGLGPSALRAVKTVVVHPTTMVLTGPRRGPLPFTMTDAPKPVLGHTTGTGPVFIAWDVARRHARHPERGHNVILHELAHRLDVLDGTFDGTPPMDARDERQRWIDVFQAEYDALRAGHGSPLLRPYAGVNPSEFFAVTTEVFFNQAAALREDRPLLYDVLTGYYRQDPASRDHGADASASA